MYARLAVLWAALLVACGPATVDTVQPNVVAKTVFDGEWYWLDTVVDVPYGTTATFVGASSSLERVRWEVQEDLLVGYRSYDNVQAVGDDPPASTTGAPIVAYRILKQFDIRRAYDRRTGEASNVIEENTERPWYDRDYLRVDWSTNVAQPPGPFTLAGVEVSLGDSHATNPDDRWAPAFDDSDGDGVIDHIRLFREVLAAPDTTRLPGYGDVPSCLFYGEAFHDCAPSEVVIGSSFLRVDPTEQYEGLVYDDRWTETFGVFQTERLHYDRRYGVTEPDRVRWANRHDLWQDSWTRDDDGRIVCQVKRQRVPCVEAHLADHPTPVPLPYDRRTVKPVVYHPGVDLDPRLAATLPRLQEAWNAPLVETINGLRFWSCVERSGDAAKCRGKDLTDLQAFVLCPHNPSQAGDPAVCSTDHTGPDGVPDGVPDPVYPGDLRYHLLDVVDTPQLASPFGYGPSAVDPVGATVTLADGTLDLGAGRIVAASAYIYGAVLDRIAASTTDLVRLVDGDIAEDAFIQGENVRAWVERLRVETGVVSLDPPLGDDRLDDEDPVPSAEAVSALGTMDTSWSAPLWARLRTIPRPTSAAQVRPYWASVNRAIEASGLVPRGGVTTRLAWERLQDSPFDELLWTPETIAAMGYDPQLLAANPGMLDGRSPLELLDPATHDAREAGLLVAGQHALDLDDGSYTNPAILGLAQAYRAQGLGYEEINALIRDELFVSVSLHEVGHTMGLRHNFAASTDAWNYPDAYWALRDDGNMGPRQVDPETPAEIAGRIREYQYSSVMDYHGNRNGDWHGLGRWDHAAIKFSYGQLVEVMTDLAATEPLPGIPADDAVNLVSYFYDSTVYPAPILNAPDGGFAELHYTDYPRIADLKARVDVPYAELVPRLPPDDGGVAGFDSFLVVGTTVPGVVAGGLPAAPYRFCSDELAGGAMCARFDEGADPYEIVTSYIRDYKDRYILDNFARERYGFGFGDYVGGIYGRTFRPLQTWARYYALFHTVLGAGFDPDAADYLAADRGLGGWTVATQDTFRFLTEVVTRPEPGRYGPTVRPDGTAWNGADATRATVDIPVGEGTYYASAWDDDSGYHWFERRSRIGTYWDRMLALQVLTTSSPYDFVGFDTTSDPRAYALGFDALWSAPLARFLGALVSDDLPEIAPVVDPDGGLTFPDPTRPSAVWPPAGREADRVEPAAFWLVRTTAGLFGNALLQEGYDRSYLRRARLFREGSGDAVTPGPGVDVVSYSDPETGLVWKAWRDVVDGVDVGVGSRMLDEANRLSAVCDGTVVPEAVDTTDADAVAWSQRVACEGREQLGNDLELQSAVQRWFDDTW
ncbi:MAG: zinc-dependent metalloprotease [Alphaproteobacteria bacterium]|nr:zinc-dependent metalloprotease [Alphaproteobacteria bacterium]